MWRYGLGCVPEWCQLSIRWPLPTSAVSADLEDLLRTELCLLSRPWTDQKQVRTCVIPAGCGLCCSGRDHAVQVSCFVPSLTAGCTQNLCWWFLFNCWTQTRPGGGCCFYLLKILRIWVFVHSCLYYKVQSSTSRSRGCWMLMSVIDDVIDILTMSKSRD